MTISDKTVQFVWHRIYMYFLLIFGRFSANRIRIRNLSWIRIRSAKKYGSGSAALMTSLPVVVSVIISVIIPSEVKEPIKTFTEFDTIIVNVSITDIF